MTIYIADYCAFHAAPIQTDAAIKPSDDTAKLLEMMGAVRFPMQRFGGMYEQIFDDISNKLKTGDILIQTSPAYTQWFDGEDELIDRVHEAKAKIIGIVHDIDAVRFGGLPDDYIPKMNKYDGLIVQSTEMHMWLVQAGLETRGQVTIMNGPWPYKTNEAYLKPKFVHQIVYGGNPDQNKSGFMKKLHQLASIPAYSMIIAGNVGFEKWMPELKNDPFFLSLPNTQSEKLPGLLADLGGFGLIMDGTECDPSDKYFNYQKYVWPHKLSLYIAAGLPVIAISGTKAAEYVKQEHIGIVVSNIDAIPHAIKNVNASEYHIYSKNVGKCMMEVRLGTHLIEAVNGAINNL